jgi:Putative Ig domain/Bacterial Ig domain
MAGSGRVTARGCFRGTRGFLASAIATLLVFSTGASVATAATRSSSARSAAVTADTSSPPYAATGYFYVTQKGAGWTLVTPQGEPFYASGIDTVSPGGSGTDRVTGVCPYCVTVANDFPNTAAWATSTVAQLRSWGFNTLGAFSDNADVGSLMPYEVQLSMASGDDWFAPSFVTNADHVAQTQVAPLANDPNVIGYFTDSELDWGPLLGPGTGGFSSALTEYLNLPAGSPGLAVAQQYVGNPTGFLNALATRYFSVTTAAIRTYDTNHLILGAKAEGQEIEPTLIKAAAPYVNVFSLEDYALPPGANQFIDNYVWPPYLPQEQNLADLEAVANIPLMIGEYTFASNANGSGDTNRLPGVYDNAQTQQQRANMFENFIAPLYEATPALVGDDWFQLVDEPANGRVGDGENSDFGMLDVNGNPYPTMASAMQLMHNVIADRTGDNGPVCDSWATGASGVACTATMPSATTSPLTIVTSTLPPGIVGNSYFVGYLFGGVFAAGGTPDYSYAVTNGSLPGGLTLNPSSGIISGTPTTAGISSFTVQATDATGAQASQNLSIDIGSSTPVSIRTTSLPNAAANQPYSQGLAATAGTSPYTWSLSGGTLPAGLTLGAGGVISGTPTVSGTFPITVTVTDSGSPATTATQSLTLEIPPSTSVLAPTAATTLQGSAYVDASAYSLNGIAGVQFEVSGGAITDKVVGTGTLTPFGYLAQWNTTSVPNGTYTLQSVATDQQGLKGVSAPVTVTVTNAAPTTSVLVPANNATVAGGSAVLDATTSANVTSVSYQLSGGAFTGQIIAAGTPTIYGWIGQWNTTTVPNGTYTLQSVASYAGGLSGTSAPINVTVHN